VIFFGSVKYDRIVIKSVAIQTVEIWTMQEICRTETEMTFCRTETAGLKPRAETCGSASFLFTTPYVPQLCRNAVYTTCTTGTLLMPPGPSDRRQRPRSPGWYRTTPPLHVHTTNAKKSASSPSRPESRQSLTNTRGAVCDPHQVTETGHHSACGFGKISCILHVHLG